MNPIDKLARYAGILYLSLVPLGFFGMYVTSRLVVPGAPAVTASNILGSELLFRLSIVSALLVQIINIFVVLLLYRILHVVSRPFALLMAIFILLGAPIAMLNELNNIAVLLLLSGAERFTTFTSSQVQDLVTLFLDLHSQGINIAGIFWGLWLFPMGYLVFRSGFLPRVLGILLIIGCLGYLVDSFAAFLLPNNAVNVALFTFWGEVLFPLWLLIKGVNVDQWEKRARESALVAAATKVSELVGS
jgi:hypothetical protein